MNASFADEVQSVLAGMLADPLLSYKFEQLGRLDPESFGDLCQHRHGGVADAALNTAYIGAVKAAFEGKRILREPELVPIFPQIEAHLATYVHGPKGARVMLLGLQPMSLISLDLCPPGSPN